MHFRIYEHQTHDFRIDDPLPCISFTIANLDHRSIYLFDITLYYYSICFVVRYDNMILYHTLIILKTFRRVLWSISCKDACAHWETSSRDAISIWICCGAKLASKTRVLKCARFWKPKETKLTYGTGTFILEKQIIFYCFTCTVYRAKKLQKQLDKLQLQLTESRAQIRDLKLQLSDIGDCKVCVQLALCHSRFRHIVGLIPFKIYSWLRWRERKKLTTSKSVSLNRKCCACVFHEKSPCSKNK